ncbi:helix-turn-helix domain-containing protein [Janthinobacterium sp.]|uniref:winged helix-turn-helix transcriptional regulator n=1 Tax=Janthinobacterium sp. TaxID=1871054 RepID=UPI00293D1EDD|nr:helix-turn-helix domain-containing protein [Janthinobacterium sp.]
MNWSEIGDTLCPIARCLAVVGDRWTMLIVRELFFGNQRFDGLQAQTGMSPHLLSARLKRLEGDGILTRAAYHAKPPRYQYCLTDKGSALHPILMTLDGWGKVWGELEALPPAVKLIHKQCGQSPRLGLACACCGAMVCAAELELSFTAAYQDERAARAALFQGAAGAPADC